MDGGEEYMRVAVERVAVSSSYLLRAATATRTQGS